MNTVLYAEKNNNIRTIIISALRKIDLDVVPIVNGHDAFIAWRHALSPRSDLQKIDLVITAVKMSEGIKLVENIRAKEQETRISPVPIIMFSSTQPQAAWLEKHEVRRVPKPDTNKLMQAVREVLGL